MSLKDDVREIDLEMFEYAGKMYTIENFSEVFNLSLEDAIDTIAVLEMKGAIKRPDPNEILDKEVRKALAEAKACRTAQVIEDDLENEQLFKEEKKREGRHVYPFVKFDFGSMITLKEFRISVTEMHLESEVLIADDGHSYMLRVINLSDRQLDNLSRLYKLNRAVKTTVETTTKAFDTAFNATDYTAKKVVVPVAKIGMAGLLNITKSIVSTGAKLTGIAVAETIKTARETSQAIKDDEAIAIAKAEMVRTKNELKGKMNSNSYGGNGITVG